MKFENKILDWSDEKVLERLYLILTQRVQVRNNLVQDDDGLVRAQVLTFQAGDKFFASPPQLLDWPMQPLPTPEALRKKVN